MAGDFFKTISRNIQDSRKRKAEEEDAIALLMAKQQMDPEVQAKQQALQAIRQSEPAPELRMSSTASPQARQQMQGRLQEAQQGQQGRILEAMQKYGLLGRGQTQAGVNVFAFDPSTGTVVPAQGGAKLPPGSRVLPTRASPEEITATTTARTAAGVQAKESEEFKNVRTAFNTSLGLLQSIPAPETQVGGFSTSQARNQLTKLGFEQDLNEYNTYTKSIAGQLAKVISREGGRLTDQDIARVTGILDQLPFLPESGRLKRFHTLNAVLIGKGFDPLFPENGITTQEGSSAPVAQVTPQQKTAYNAARSQGKSAAEARRLAGF